MQEFHVGEAYLLPFPLPLPDGFGDVADATVPPAMSAHCVVPG